MVMPYETRSLLIIGGKGKMGQLFARAFTSPAFDIRLLDKDDSITEEIVSAADIVMISVPMNVAAHVAHQVAPLVREDALLCDLNSLKSEICGIFEKESKSESLGLHPMFGPSLSDLKGQKVIVCPVKRGDLARQFEQDLKSLGLELHSSSPDQHDKMMGMVQVLTHFNAIVMGEALKKSGIPLADSLPFTSPVYKLELSIVGRLFAQDAGLYGEILTQNPYTPSMLSIYQSAVDDIKNLVVNKQTKEFCDKFVGTKNYLADFSDEAFELSQELIKIISCKV